MTPDKGMPWSGERTQAVRSSLARIVSVCADKNIDLLLISGNLFGGQPSYSQCEEANGLFASIPATKVFIISGDMDHLTPSSAVRTYEWSDNVIWFTGAEPETAEAGGDIVVHGLSCSTSVIKEGLPEEYRVPDDGKIHILLMCAARPSQLTAEGESYVRAGFTYAALGHSHTFISTAGGAAVCSGSPEPLGPEDTGTHGYCQGEISQGRLTGAALIPLSQVRYVNLTVHMTPATTADEIYRSLGYEMERRGKNNIYSISLKGLRDPAVEFRADELKDRFRISSVADESEPKYDLADLFRKHPSDMIGFFIKEMNVPDASPVDRKALYYGIDALLHTAGE